jgi:hypothetical protein
MDMTRCLLIPLIGMIAFLCDAKLKVTWDVDDYVQNGLIAHYDGIRNVGADLPHDNNPSSWSNLVANTQGYAVLKKMKGIGDNPPDHGSWTDKGYEFKGYSYFETQDSSLELGSNFTVQIVAEIDSLHYDDGVHDYHNIWGSQDAKCSMFLDRAGINSIAGSNLTFKVDVYNANGATGNRPNITLWDGRYANFAFNDEYTCAYATEYPYWWKTSQWGRQREHISLVGIPGSKYVWGGRHASYDNCKSCAKGKFYAWRAYSRMLTDSELAWNRMIDEVRFHGATELLVTNVVVSIDSLGRSGVEPSGAYVVDGSHTFSAGMTSVDGCTYQAYGYTLETFDSATGTWSDAQYYDGTSVTVSYNPSNHTPPVRITWQWKYVSGIERLDVHHYIQDGLIAHYDGIRNMGAGLPHNNTATTWSNLVSGTLGVGSLGKANGISPEDVPDHGFWTDKGYLFKGYSYFSTSGTMTLGSEFTVQIAGDFDMSDFADGVHKFYKFWTSSDGDLTINLGMDRSYPGAIAGNLLYLYADRYKGDKERPQFIWHGKYVTIAFDEEYAYITEEPYYITNQWGFRREITAITPVPALQYSWGGKYGSNKNPQYCSRGEFYNWRAYSRKLTNFELAWNRDVDEIRYHGGMPTTISNAVVVASAQNDFAANEEGVYLLTDMYEFSAERKNVDGTTFTPAYTIESWDNSSSVWVKTLTSSDDSCILRQLDSAVPRRIVWKWHKEGFSVILR